MDRSDPEVLRHYNKAWQRSLENAKEPYTADVLALCRSDNLDSERVIMIQWKVNGFDILYLMKSATLSLEESHLNFSSPKNRQTHAVQNNKNDTGLYL